MNTTSKAIAVWTRFFPDKRKRGLEWLPEDIILDEIMSRLDVRDILALRLTCKILYHLTRQPAVWRRFLPHLGSMAHPLPLLSPMKKYSPDNIAYRDIETWISRAVSLDANWKRLHPKPMQVVNYETYFRTLSMVMLPGGHFLVASVRDKNGNYGLLIWVMDHPGIEKGGAMPLVWRDTEVKAYNLQARYTTVGGARGVSISFLRKWHKDPLDTRDVPETHRLGGDADPEDPFMPLRYECTTLQISLEILERLTDRKAFPETYHFVELTRELGDPFKVVSRVRTGTQLGAIILTEVDHQPHVVIVKRPNSIIFVNLNDNSRSVLTCQENMFYPDHLHRIWGIRFLPAQNQIFVVRAVDRTADALCTQVLFEFYEVPAPGHEITLPAMEFRRLVTYNIVAVQIAEIPSPLQEGFVDWPQLDGKFPPSPLSIYLIESRSGFVHYSIWPVWVDVQSNGHLLGGKETSSVYYYSLHSLVGQTSIMFTKKGTLGEVLVLPGASRAIMYTIPFNTRNQVCILKSLNAYISPDHGKELSRTDVFSMRPFPNSSKRETLKVWPYKPKEYKGNCCKPLSVPDNLKDELKWGGVTAMAWDESSGRLCLAAKNLRTLSVFDFGQARLEDKVDEDLTTWQDTPLAVDIIED